jgi:hypothetical protein
VLITKIWLNRFHIKLSRNRHLQTTLTVAFTRVHSLDIVLRHVAPSPTTMQGDDVGARVAPAMIARPMGDEPRWNEHQREAQLVTHVALVEHEFSRADLSL